MGCRSPGKGISFLPGDKRNYSSSEAVEGGWKRLCARGESKGAADPAGRDAVREAGSPGASGARSPEPGAMALPGERPPRPQALFSLLAPCVPDNPSSEQGRQRQKTAADGSARVDGGPRPGLSTLRSAGRWSAGGLGEGCPAAARAARPGCQAPLAAPRRRWGGEGGEQRPRPAFPGLAEPF